MHGTVEPMAQERARHYDAAGEDQVLLINEGKVVNQSRLLASGSGAAPAQAERPSTAVRRA